MTQGSGPEEVVLSGFQNKDSKRVPLPGEEKAQPGCFGASQLRIPEHSESDRLCSTCTSLGHPNSTRWKSINNFLIVIVDHHHSFDALLKSAHEGCHLCGLLLIAWEEKWYLEQESGIGWAAKRWSSSASLNAGIRLEFRRVIRTLAWNSVVVDEVQISILCGDTPLIRGGRLICNAMDSKRSSFLGNLHFLTINHRSSRSPCLAKSMSPIKSRHQYGLISKLVQDQSMAGHLLKFTSCVFPG